MSYLRFASRDYPAVTVDPTGYVCDDTPVYGTNVLNDPAGHAAVNTLLMREVAAVDAGIPGQIGYGTDDADVPPANDSEYAFYPASSPPVETLEERSTLAWWYLPGANWGEYAPRISTANPRTGSHHARHTIGRMGQAGGGYRNVGVWGGQDPARFYPVGVIDCSSGYPMAAAVTAGMTLAFSVYIATTISNVGGNVQGLMHPAGSPGTVSEVGPSGAYGALGSGYTLVSWSWTPSVSGFVSVTISLTNNTTAPGEVFDAADAVLAIT